MEHTGSATASRPTLSGECRLARRVVIVIVLVCCPAIYHERWSPALRILMLMFSLTAAAVTLMWVHTSLS